MDVDCDGHFVFVRADQGNDPAVYTHGEQEPTFYSCERLSDYLGLIVDQFAGAEEIRQLQKELAHIEIAFPQILARDREFCTETKLVTRNLKPETKEKKKAES